MATPKLEGCFHCWKPNSAILGWLMCTLVHAIYSSQAFSVVPLSFRGERLRRINTVNSPRPSKRGDPETEHAALGLTITTFNILAPIFKRVDTGRESQFRDDYIERHISLLEHLKGLDSDVICVQELWVAQPEIVGMFRSALKGYQMYLLPRTGSRGDGLGCFVKEGIAVLDRQDLRLKDIGDRVALILRLRLGGRAGTEGRGDKASGSKGRGQGVFPPREVVVANTHLLFPHDRTFIILRLREVKKLLAFMECYTQTQDLGHLPVVLCGDFNGRLVGRVSQHIAERGFRCSFEDVLGPGADHGRWITHRNHLGEELGVDYIWYRNPDDELGPMEPEWEKIVYQSTKRQLLNSYHDSAGGDKHNEGERSSPAETDDVSAVDSMDVGSTETLQDEQRPLNGSPPASDGSGTGGYGKIKDDEEGRLSAAVALLALNEGLELNEDEAKVLLDSSADDFDFLIPTILDGSSTGLEGASSARPGRPSGSRPGECRLKPTASRIWPKSLEQGVWPPDFTISDHGSVTAEFHVLSPPGGNQRGTSIGGDLDLKDAASAAAVDDYTGVGGGLDFSRIFRLESRRDSVGGSRKRLKGTTEGAGDFEVDSDADADAEPADGDQ